MFVKTEEIPVYLPEDEHLPHAERNTIYIRAKMDYGTRKRVQEDGMRARAGASDSDPMELLLGGYQPALLIHNILRWSGPAFRGYPCTRENILLLDPTEPLIGLVEREIGRRNRRTQETDQKKSPNGVIDYQASEAYEVMDTPSTTHTLSS